VRLAINGIRVNVEQWGSGQPLVLLHGFTGNAATWAEVAAALPGFRCVAIDLVGHGETDKPAEVSRYAMQACVADVLGVIDELELDQPALLGYSMGARVALQVAAKAQERFSALILESGSPGLRTARERSEREEGDMLLAERLQRGGLSAFIDFWEAQSLFASHQNLPSSVWDQQRSQRLHNDPLGLANSLRGMGTGRQSSLWEWLPRLNLPTLLLAGELDTKYVSINEEMAGLIPEAQLQVIEQSGHTVHLEQPAAFLNALTSFLAAHPATATTAA
jgi:2-succinyl-6-hydroxy-2,4-cyclohexadiene-1-carboxylate synthase